jgi:hypothetical protein
MMSEGRISVCEGMLNMPGTGTDKRSPVISSSSSIPSEYSGIWLSTPVNHYRSLPIVTK